MISMQQNYLNHWLIYIWNEIWFNIWRISSTDSIWPPTPVSVLMIWYPFMQILIYPCALNPSFVHPTRWLINTITRWLSTTKHLEIPFDLIYFIQACLIKQNVHKAIALFSPFMMNVMDSFSCFISSSRVVYILMDKITNFAMRLLLFFLQVQWF